jgi:Uncharacterized conserved protein
MNSAKSHPFSRLTHLGEMPVDTFLSEYWQKKPLLVRNAFPNFVSPVSADELAGFALEEDVVSRLVVHDREAGHWQVEHGPLADSTFSTLPKVDWTLLVQHADLLDPDINQLLEAFRFIPSWRLDDIMISYAADGGGVGPHFDYYDVFLLQAQGSRNWKLGQTCNTESPLLPGLDMKILRDFEQTQEWLVNPGDLLYIPPNIAHWGEAKGKDCITYSVGFRAPSYSDILLDFAEEMASQTNQDMRYSDAAHKQQRLFGEITPETVAKVSQILQTFVGNPSYVANWFGEYMTRPNPGGDEASRTETSMAALNAHQCRLNAFARCAYYETSDHCIVFINGEKWHCSKALAVLLSNYEPLNLKQLNTKEQYLVRHLAEEGLLEPADD